MKRITKGHNATIRAGIPQSNHSLYHAIRFSVGDPVAWMEIAGEGGTVRRVLIIRDIEMARARECVQADEIACPADYEPEAGLSADREIATAQAAAECLRRNGVTDVVADRTLPMSFAHVMREAGIAVDCDLEMGVRERRVKDATEFAMLKHSQSVTEEAIVLACEMIARAEAGKDGVLRSGGSDLTSERVRAEVNHFLMQRGFSGPEYIIAGGPQAADCHFTGSGVLRTGQPVIVDIFPMDRKSRYWGDCTRTVVHGEITEEVARMHAAVCAAKAAAIGVMRPGVTGRAVHAKVAEIIAAHGFSMVSPSDEDGLKTPGMNHGTGHGVGLDVHEPILLDAKGGELLAGEVLTVEPALYRLGLGGVRVEDMVAVTADGCENFNRLPEGLHWK